MALSRQTKIGIFLVAVTLFVTFGVYIYQVLFSPNVLVKQPPKMLYIPTGASYQDVLNIMKEERYVADLMSFAALAKAVGYPAKVKPGAYLIPENSDNLSIIKMLASGRQTPVKVVFHSVRTVKDLATRLGQQLEVDTTTLLERLRNEDTCRAYGFTPATITAMFIPNTYEFYWNASPVKIWKKMKGEYNTFWSAERVVQATAQGLTPVQATTLASIVQWETQKIDEMPVVAGVYLNRLRQDMALQADPTVIFAVGDFSIKRVLVGHTRFDSPYNTYRYKGLPPGPINLPGIAAVDAVLHPAVHNYLFFVAKADFSGYHTFSEDYATHLKNAAKYQKALNARAANSQVNGL